MRVAAPLFCSCPSWGRRCWGKAFFESGGHTGVRLRWPAVVAESNSKSPPSPRHIPARLTIRSAPQPALKAGMPGWVFAGSIRVRDGLEPLMACTDTSCSGAALAMRASRPEKSHPGVTAGARSGSTAGARSGSTAGARSGNTAVASSGNSLSYPESPLSKAWANTAMAMRRTLARLRSGWRVKAVRAAQTTSGCFQVRQPNRQRINMEVTPCHTQSGPPA